MFIYIHMHTDTQRHAHNCLIVFFVEARPQYWLVLFKFHLLCFFFFLTCFAFLDKGSSLGFRPSELGYPCGTVSPSLELGLHVHITIPGSYMDTGDQTQFFHVCMANNNPTGLFPNLQCSAFKILYNLPIDF